MKALDIKEVLAKDEQLRMEIKELREAIYNEMVEILKANGRTVRFAPKVEYYYSNREHSSITKLIKGFRLDKDDKIEELLEYENKPMLAMYNPSGTWYQMTFKGFQAIRELSYNLEILREAVKK